MTRIVVVSDSHLSGRTPDAVRNWDAVVAHVAQGRPDLVVHLGDLTLDAQHAPEELGPAAAHLERLAAPWRVVPGNHDVGDDHAGSPEEHLDETRRGRWLDVVGPDWWSLDLDAVTVIGLDAQLFGSGLAAEAEQWIWLGRTLAAAGPDRGVVLALHKPVTAPAAELAAARGNRFAPAAARQRLALLCAGRRATTLTASGHVHQQRHLHVDGAPQVWAPSTWGVFPDSTQTTVGTKRTGLVDLDLDGAGDVTVRFVRPDGLAQLTVGVDTPDPFD